MLLNDVQAALAEVDVRCRTAAARYADAANMSGGTGLTARLSALCSERERFAARLEGEMRGLGVLPREAGSEIEELHSLASHVKAVVTGEEAKVGIEAAAGAERDLEAAVGEALRHDLPAPVRRLLETLRDAIDLARGDLAALRRDR